MDIARAIAQINPQSEYLLTNSNATSWKDILEWYGPGEKPTPEQLEAAWREVLVRGDSGEREGLCAEQDGSVLH